MPEDSSSLDYAMEKASGPHFSGLRFDGLLSSSPPNSSVVSSLRSAVSSSSPSSSDPEAPKQPFIIGDFSNPISL
jgi:uridine kinase